MDPSRDPADLPDAWNLCAKIALDHYENFPVGSRFVRAEFRPHMHAIYAFARTADDFADEPEFEGERLHRLAQWRQRLHDAAGGRASDPVFKALCETIRVCGVPIEWLDDLIKAFETDVRKSCHETFGSIVDYAKLSANPVGRLVLWVHGYRDERLFALSDSICTALQFANFWQDVCLDWGKGRIYLPKEDMRSFQYTKDDLDQQVADERFQGLLRLEIARTRELFYKGRELCDRVGPELRRELRLVWWGGMRILMLIERARYDVFRRRPKIGFGDKAWMLWRAFTWPSGSV